MNCTNTLRDSGRYRLRAGLMVSFVAMITALGACGGGGDSAMADPDPTPTAGCEPGDSGDCGTVLLGITDAAGDFLSYSVDIVAIDLRTAAGREVEILPQNTRIDFASYVDLTEILAAADIPAGNYVAGRITLNYDNAEIVVEKDGTGAAATVVDSDGNAVSQMTFDIVLDDRNHLIITRGRASLLTVDFDLAAAHAIDLATTPVEVTVEPFIVAEIDPLITKDIRVRGALVSVDESAMSYTIALRPFVDHGGDFGRFEVQVGGATEFEIDGTVYTGADGLAALSAAGTGTLTIARGTLNVAERTFTANLVLAGSSVPGMDGDAVIGNVVARDGDTLHVHGATVIRADQAAFFDDDIVVTVGPDTQTFKPGADEPLSAAIISVGQSVAVRGEIVATDPGQPMQIDATAGAVRLNRTHLAGTAVAVNPGRIDIDLQTIDHRRVDRFDFTGTGPARESDADPDNYEVATGSLSLQNQAVGKPVTVYGFPSDFGTAPPDFEGRTVVDFASLRGALAVGWGAEGTTAPFLSMNTDGLVIDSANPDIDGRHYVRQGPVLIDLTTLDSGTTLVARDDGRRLFSIASQGSVALYSSMDEFVAALQSRLDGTTAMRSLYARGAYDATTNRFAAYKIGVYLLEP